MTGLRVTVPIPVTDAVLTASDVPESDYPAWASGTTYALRARVIHAHKIWESAAEGNQGNEPGAASAAWLFVSATNRWKAFDLEQVTATAQAGGMGFTLEPDVPVNALHVLSMSGVDSVRVRVYDRDAAGALVYDSGARASGLLPTMADWWSYCFGPWVIVSQIHFTAMPYVVSPRMQIDLVGGDAARVGCIVVGNTVEFGDKPGCGVENGVDVETLRSASFRDNDFDIPTMTRRATREVASFNVTVAAGDADEFADFNHDSGSDVCFYTIAESWRITQILGTITRFRARMRKTDGQIQMEVTGVPQQ